ncbi:MAG TPA: hypothetical protein VE907_18315 [Gammaproteobacteria bacterium]|nr:hypothetical protein [Gammaproteobacteria bacterium]
MKFGSNHYVPVLKVKANEKAALLALGSTHAGQFTPLLEVVKRTGLASMSKHLDTAFKNLATAVAKCPRCFLDARELAPEGDAGAKAVFSCATAEGIAFTPVVGLTRKVGNAPAFAHAGDGVALRLTRSELEKGVIAGSLGPFMTTHKLDPAAVDLIIDMGEVESLIPVGVGALAAAFLAAIPHHGAWRTFTLSGCAFPRTLGGVDRLSAALAQRSEWIAWRDYLYSKRAALPRLPTFSDCGIQHPSGVEGFDPTKMTASAAARYSVADSWLLVKGESTKKVSPTIQFPKIAKRIVANTHGPHFCGAGHCDGCDQIIASAGGAPKLGSLGVWRRIGTIHHVAIVRRDLASLRWP